MSRIRFTTARGVFEAYPAAASDIHAKPSDEPPLVFLRTLTASDTPEDAVGFCAYMLPRLEAVLWACRCVRALSMPRSEPEEAALKAAEDWVREPGEDRRREALNIGSEGERSAPTTWLALAAGWSGGSMMPVDQPPIPCPAYMTAKAARAAVLTALARIPLKQRLQGLTACLDEGLRCADAEATSIARKNPAQ